MIGSENRSTTLVFVNSPTGTAIGEVGNTFVATLRGAGYAVSYREATVTWRGFAKQLFFLLSTRDWLILNAGLTNWGRSSARNLLGFLSVSLRSRLIGRTIVALHTVIEVIESQYAGYRVTWLTRKGAHFAVTLLSGSKIIVFSKVISDLLRNKYGVEAAICTPIPCEVGKSRSVPSGSDPPLVLFIGHLSLYKGIDTALRVAKLLASRASLKLIGPVHWILKEDRKYALWLASVRESARNIGVAMPGYLPTRELDKLLSQATAGLLPYDSTNGASASFATFASAGVPVITSDLPEFRWLRELGAGIVIARGPPENYAEAVIQLIENMDLRQELAASQMRFAAAHTWSQLVCQVRELIGRSANPVR
jgi:glycosyltransferase involved in cell wall biosynthesis